MGITAAAIKEKAKQIGCDLCGIASTDRFLYMPGQSNPVALLPDAKSVIAVAKKFLGSTVKSNSTIPYTILRNNLSRYIDDITVQLAYYLEDNGYSAIPTGAIDPCNYNHEIEKKTGLISLKNAAYQAGLGVIGKNTLLITPEYGNMVWLGAIITSAKLECDKVLEKNPCNTNCSICIDKCPVHAIDGSHFMDQKKCWDYAFGEEDGGEWRIKCFECRVLCPHSRGYNPH